MRRDIFNYMRRDRKIRRRDVLKGMVRNRDTGRLFGRVDWCQACNPAWAGGHAALRAEF